jgi:23S rRNA (uracil1939-C5)-methyltransferase
MEGTINSGPSGPANHTIEVKRLALHGDGVGRIVSGGDRQGKVAFVPYTLPGETVDAQPAEEKKNYLRCIPREVLESSPDRITPSCPYHFSYQKTDLWCGGCNWQHMTPGKQREAKKDLVLETLHRLGRMPEFPDINFLHTEKIWRYRNNAQFVFGRRDEASVAGYYAPGSHDVVPVADCLIQSPAAIRILTTVRHILPELGLQPFERKHGRGWLKHLLIRSNEEGNALITFVTADARFPRREQLLHIMTAQCPEITGMFQNVQPSRTSVITGTEWIHLWGNRRLKEHICGLTFATSPDSFLQVNTGAAQLLYRRALDEAQLQPDMTVLDLYCGAGALALLAASSAAQVIGVDELTGAIDDARANARENGVDRVTFHSLTAERFLNHARSQKTLPADRLVTFIDPPRAGCERYVIEGLLALAPRRIIYISCNPATLARDLEALCGTYQLASLTIVDLFPQTSHIETIARLERKSSPVASH